MNLFYQMKQQASVHRTYKKEMVVARSTIVHLRHSARAQPRPLMLWNNLAAGLVIQSQQLAAGFRPVRSASEVTLAWLNVEQSATETFDQ